MVLLCLGISNESGYGSMTRRSAHLRPQSGDEDVFSHANHARVSNLTILEIVSYR